MVQWPAERDSGAEREQRELFSHRGDAFSGIGGAREEAVRRRCRVCKGARGGDAVVGDVGRSVEKMQLQVVSEKLPAAQRFVFALSLPLRSCVTSGMGP